MMDNPDDRVDEDVLSELMELGIRSLMDTFEAETAKRIQGLKAAVAGDDLTETARVAHSVKGSAGAFGARRVSALGEQVEVASKAGDKDAVAELLPLLESEFQAFVAIVASRFAP